MTRELKICEFAECKNAIIPDCNTHRPASRVCYDEPTLKVKWEQVILEISREQGYTCLAL